MGETLVILMSRRITSDANKVPAIGALKVAEMPAAAPHPTSTVTAELDSLKYCPKTDPIAEPICTIGPSLPTDPPEPMVIADTNIFTRTIRSLIMPPFLVTADITSGTP